MARILTVGITVLDTIMAMVELPRHEGKFYARDRSEVVGGIAANAAIAVRRLGGEAVLASRLGDDLAGERIIQDLTTAGVDTSRLEWLNGVKSSVSTILVDAAGERILINHADPALFRGAPAPFDDLPVDAVMTDTRWPEAALAALCHARLLGVPGIIDYDRDALHLKPELLAAASHIVCGRQGLAGLAGTDDIEAGLRSARRLTAAWLACTSGANGVHWLDGDTVHHLPGFRVAAVDTLGAGDVFHGAFALALAEGMDALRAMRFASAAAALKCRRFGGGSVAPGRSEVETFLQEAAAGATHQTAHPNVAPGSGIAENSLGLPGRYPGFGG